MLKVEEGAARPETSELSSVSKQRIDQECRGKNRNKRELKHRNLNQFSV